MKKNLTHLLKNSTNTTQEILAPLVREFQPIAAGLKKRSAVLREIRPMVSALLTQTR